MAKVKEIRLRVTSKLGGWRYAELSWAELSRAELS
jgi:hypothetical protein